VPLAILWLGQKQYLGGATRASRLGAYQYLIVAVQADVDIAQA
jgi:hypothetical protein